MLPLGGSSVHPCVRFLGWSICCLFVHPLCVLNQPNLMKQASRRASLKVELLHERESPTTLRTRCYGFHQVYSVQRFSLKLFDCLTLYMQLTMFSCSCLKVPMLFRCSQHNSLFACGSKLVCGLQPFSFNSTNICSRKTDRALHFNLWKQHTDVSMVQWSVHAELCKTSKQALSPATS